MMKTGIYPPEIKSVNLDTDWVYRKGLPMLWRHTVEPVLMRLRKAWEGLLVLRDSFLHEVGLITDRKAPW